MGAVWDALAEVGLSTLSVVGMLARAFLLWLVVALAAAIALFLLLRRLGWLDPGPTRARWARISFGLILFGMSGPVATITLVTGSVRNEVCAVVLEHCGRLGLSEKVGRLALAPLVVTRNLVHKKRVSPGALLQLQPEDDVSFLLARRNNLGVALLSGRLTRMAANRVDRDGSALERLVVKAMLRHELGSMEQRLAFYRGLLDGLKPDAAGKLTWRAAGFHVGQRLLRHNLIPVLRAPFNHLMLILALIAAVPPLLWLGVLGLVRRRRRRATG